MKNIVIGIDFSENSINSLRHAVAVSLKTGATLHLVWVKTPGAVKGLGKGNIDDFTVIAQKKLDDLIDRCKAEAPNSPVVSVILEGKPYLELPKYASNQPDSFLFLGTHGMSGFEERFVGSNAFKIVGESKVPVLVIREGVNINRDLVHVLVPIDTSFETLQKMRPAITFAKAFSAKILLLGLIEAGNKDDKHVVTIQLGHANRMCAEANVRHDSEMLEIKGPVSEFAINYGKEKDANLMIIMREEDANIGDIFVGITTRQLLNRAPIPLLIIPNISHFSVNK